MGAVVNKLIRTLGKPIYRMTPFGVLRRFYVSAYHKAVRGKTIVANCDGINYELDLSEMIDCAVYIGSYENDVTSYLQSHCKRGQVVLDIGANMGAHSLNIAKYVGENGRVYAFEPTQYAFAKLKKNVSLNDFRNIRIYRLALSSKNEKDCTISYRSSWKTDGSYMDSTCVVDSWRLDDWAEKEEIARIDLIKLDVDGNEFTIIEGGEKSITKLKPSIVIEIWAQNFGNVDTNPYARLMELGYRFHSLDGRIEFRTLEELELPLLGRNGALLDTSYNAVAR